MKLHKIHRIVSEHEGIKCAQVVQMTGWTQSSVSGLLSRLKAKGKVINRNGCWMTVSKFGSSELDIIKRLKDITDGSLYNLWSEGYVSALADHNIIDEESFSKLIEFIKVN